MNKILLITVVFTFSLSLHAQDSLYTEASRSFANAKYENAYEQFKKAGISYRLNDQFSAYAQCNMYMGLCLTRLGLFNECIELIENTLDYQEEVIPQNNYLKAEGKRILGEAYLNIGRNDQSLDLLKEAESLYSDSALVEKSECYNSLGVTYWNNGNRDLAKQYHERALQIRIEKWGRQSIQVANSFNNLGILYLDENDIDATLYFNRALRIYRKELGDIHPQVAYGMINLARSKSNQGIYSEAYELLAQAQEIWDSIYETDHPSKAFTYSSIGRVQAEEGKLDEAIITQQNALKIYVKLYGAKHPEVANTYFLIGDYHQKKAEFKLALENYQRAIYSNIPQDNFTSIYDLPSLKNYLNGDYLLTALLAKAKVLEAIHLEKTLRPKDLKAAIHTYQKADSLVSQLRNIRVNEVDKLKLAETSRLIYSNGIELTSILTRQPFLGKLYMSTLFDFFEKSKSAVLLDAIQDTKAKSYAGIPDEILKEEDSLKKELVYLQLKVAGGDESKEVQNSLFIYKTAYAKFTERLENDYPTYYSLKYQNNSASLDELQASLSQDKVVIMYLWDEDRLHILQINAEKSQLESKTLPENTKKLIAGYRNTLKYNTPSRDLSIQLYSLLIPENILGEDIIFMPDGLLNMVPFEALINPVNGKYLIEEKMIAYDYSASLFLMRNSENKSYRSDILLLAPITFEGYQERLSPLPGTKKEAEELQTLFRENNKTASIYLEAEANEETLASSLKENFRYMHFATHGIVNESTPELSCIYLQPDSSNDGKLYSGDIYTLSFDAELVTLSACETGLGRISKGEGIIGLSRALLYAGADNLLVSLWQVSDQASAQLMTEFYKNHLNDSVEKPFHEALKEAKLTLINSEEFSAPYFWAPFILIGI